MIPPSPHQKTAAAEAPEVGGGAGGGAGQLHTNPQDDLGGTEYEGVNMTVGEIILIVAIVVLFITACLLVFCYRARQRRRELDEEEARRDRESIELEAKQAEAEAAGRRVVEHISVVKIVNGRSVDEPGCTSG